MAEKVKPAQLITTGDAEHNIVVWNKAKRIADYLSAGGESAAKGDVTRLLEQIADLLDDRDALAAKINEVIDFGDSLENFTTNNIAPKDEYRITQGIVENGSGSGATRVSSLKAFKEGLDTVLKRTSELYSLQNAIDKVPVLARSSTNKVGDGNLPTLAMKYLRVFGPTNEADTWVGKTASELASAGNHFNQAALIRTPNASVISTVISASDVTAKLRDIYLSGTGEWINFTNAVKAIINSSTSSVIRLGVNSPSAINYTASGHSVSIPAVDIKINGDPFGDSVNGLKDSYTGTYNVCMGFGNETVAGVPSDPVSGTTHAPELTFNFNNSNGPATKSLVRIILVRKSDGAVMSEAIGNLK